MDGVNDALDICPGSPQGEEVDGYGCAASQRDTDSDGIKDHLDHRPASPPGANVNGYGCADSEWDSDEDGCRWMICAPTLQHLIPLIV